MTEEKTKQLVQILKDAGVPFGASSRNMLVTHAARSCALDDPKKFFSIVCPYALDTEAFDPLEPKISSAALGSVESVAKVIKLLVHERFVPMIKKGRNGADLLAEYADNMTEMQATQPKDFDELIKGAVDDVGDRPVLQDPCRPRCMSGLRDQHQGGERRSQEPHQDSSDAVPFLDAARHRSTTDCVGEQVLGT